MDHTKIRARANELLSGEREPEAPLTPEILRFCRKWAGGLSQVQLAQRAKVSDSKLSLFENGLVQLTPEESRRVKKVLNRKMLEVQKILKNNPHADPHLGNLRQLAGMEAPTEAEARAYDEWYAAHVERPQRVQDRRFLRKHTGMSQRELARASRIPRNKIIEWEAGRVDLTAEEQSRWDEAIRTARVEKKRSDPWWKLTVAHYTIEDLLKERKRYLPRLENITSVDDPVIQEITASFRREIADLEAALRSQKVQTDADD
jgi:transcriptional regulator with XRE-family HTH domain